MSSAVSQSGIAKAPAASATITPGHAGIGATSIKYAIETLGRLEYVLRNERGEYRIEDPIFDLWLQHGPSLEQK